MKKMITLAALAAISTSASAFDYKFNLEGRSDFAHDNVKTTTAAGAETTGQANGFITNLVRLNMAGTINENLSYRFRFRFQNEGSNTVTTPVAGTRRDGSTSSLDYLYIDHKNSLFTTRFGKMNWAEAYGRESFISSTDLFILSEAYNAYNTNIGNYRFGVAATYTFMDANKLTLAISNPNPVATDAGTVSTVTGITTPTDANNKSLAYAVHYSSSFFNKAFQPTLSYTVANQDGDQQASTLSAKYQMMAAGFRTEALENLIVDADWKQFKREKRTAATADDKTTSIFANMAYNMGEFSPFVQYIHDQFSTELASKATEYKQNSIAGGVMWKPFNDVNFRYHLLYTNINRKLDAATGTSINKVTDNRITFGIKADI